MSWYDVNKNYGYTNAEFLQLVTDANLGLAARRAGLTVENVPLAAAALSSGNEPSMKFERMIVDPLLVNGGKAPAASVLRHLASQGGNEYSQEWDAVMEAADYIEALEARLLAAEAAFVQLRNAIDVRNEIELMKAANHGASQ